MHPYMPIALALAMLIGFAAHRASLCTVRAVAEVMSSGTVWMLASFLKAAAWAAAIAGTLMLIYPASTRPTLEQTSHVFAAAGVFVIGVLAASGFGAYLGTGSVRQVSSFWLSEDALVLPLLLLLWLWVLVESIRLWRSSIAGAGFGARLLAPAYRLSSAAALLGIAAGVLYNVQGAWSYTNLLRVEAASWLGAAATPSAYHALLVITLITGMVASAWQRRSFSLGIHWRQWPRWSAGELPTVECSSDQCR